MEPNAYYQRKRDSQRFPPDLDDLESTRLYFRNHAISLLYTGVVWSGIVEPLDDWGAQTTWTRKGGGSASTNSTTQSEEVLPNTNADAVGYSVYVFRSHRGKGHMSAWLERNPDKIIFTVRSCDLEDFLQRKNAKFELMDEQQDSNGAVGDDPPPSAGAPAPAPPAARQELRHRFDPEYALVRDFYGDKVTDRTGAHMINHVDEGIWILQRLGAADTVIRAYILHPLVQGDAELAAFWENGLDSKLHNNPRVMQLALEYRNIANAHLSWHPPPSESPFSASPLREVNQMLVADKVQNRKDFELYHLGLHPRSARLAAYFEEWLEKLGVEEAQYQFLCTELLERTGGVELAKLQQAVVGSASREGCVGETDQLGYKQVFGSSRKSSWFGGRKEVSSVVSSAGFFWSFCLGVGTGILLFRWMNEQNGVEKKRARPL